MHTSVHSGAAAQAQPHACHVQQAHLYKACAVPGPVACACTCAAAGAAKQTAGGSLGSRWRWAGGRDHRRALLRLLPCTGYCSAPARLAPAAAAGAGCAARRRRAAAAAAAAAGRRETRPREAAALHTWQPMAAVAAQHQCAAACEHGVDAQSPGEEQTERCQMPAARRGSTSLLSSSSMLQDPHCVPSPAQKTRRQPTSQAYLTRRRYSSTVAASPDSQSGSASSTGRH